jgi:hypothetical protein
MDPVIYAIALVSFLAGSFGYVSVRFVLLPIGRYRRIRRQIARMLVRINRETATGGETAGFLPAKGGNATTIRQLSRTLSDCFTDQLPHWYKLHLTQRRGESPIEASKNLMALANTRNNNHAVRQMEKIKQHLRID